MDEREKQNIIRVLNLAISAIKNEDFKVLKELSDETIHDTTVYQDEYTTAFAVLIYSLSKIHERDLHYSKFKGWKKFCDNCYIGLESAKEKISKNDFEGFATVLRSDILELNKIDPKLKLYIQDVLQKARINKASRLYEHGISMGRTAELLGITRFELMDYVGKTYIADVKESLTMNAKKRLEFARGSFL